MYFYIGGVSAGAYFIGSLVELLGNVKQREISRIAYYIAFPLICITPILLIADLGQPVRFWHLFFYTKDGIPYINHSHRCR
jgi:formate-dependent nitrite reductase membrane component NrfD